MSIQAQLMIISHARLSVSILGSKEQSQARRSITCLSWLGHKSISYVVFWVCMTCLKV